MKFISLSSGNPADLLTRGIRSDALFASQLWNNGHFTMFRSRESKSIDDDLLLNEGPQSPPSDAGIAHVIDPTYYGDLQKLLRTAAWVFRFINILRKRRTRKSPTLKESEVHQAQNVWIRETQSQVYRDELTNLKTNTTPRIPLVRQLQLFLLEDNIIRCGDRIHNAPLQFSASSQFCSLRTITSPR